MKKLIAMLLALVMVLGLVACGGEKAPETTGAAVSADPTETAQAVTENAVYRTLYSAEVTTLNYLITGQTNELSIAANVVDCLVEYDAYGNVEPALATSWEQNEDATVWTFKIREGLKWIDHTGAETEYDVTAQDFVDGIRYIADPLNGGYPMPLDATAKYDVLDSVEAIYFSKINNSKAIFLSTTPFFIL